MFQKEEEQQLIQAIQEAENKTSSEIRVHIEKKCKKTDPVDRAVEVFFKLKMEKTKDRNGVLFYLASEDKKFAVLGDQGIDKLVPDDFWQETKEQMQLLFREQKFLDGLLYGIEKAGIELKKFFPIQADDVNELSDEISYG